MKKLTKLKFTAETIRLMKVGELRHAAGAAAPKTGSCFYCSPGATDLCPTEGCSATCDSVCQGCWPSDSVCNPATWAC